MISILIPVFNYDVRALVKQLSRQAVDSGWICEIIVMDDGSAQDVVDMNNEVKDLPLVRYVVSGVNLGRLQTRYELARQAAYEWLLFLDDDSGLVSDRFFLKEYMNSLTGERRVIVGGRIYSNTRPPDCTLVLHWKYGRNRESAWHRINKVERRGFQTNNFMIHRDVYFAIRLPAGMAGYGHEDTWMGMELERLGIDVHHIDNPVIHQKLESATRVIEKATSALQNLRAISKADEHNYLARHVKLYRLYIFLKNVRMLPVVERIYRILQKRIEVNLHSCFPRLFFFDLFRLNQLISTFR